MQSPDILDIVPERVADPVRREPWPARLRTACGDGLVSLLLNGAVVGWMIGVGWPLRAAAPPPEAISVELVDHVPGQPGGPGAAKSSAPDATAAKAAEADAKPQPGREDPVKLDAPTPMPEAQPKPETEKAAAAPEPQPEPAIQEAEAPAAAPAEPPRASSQTAEAPNPVPLPATPSAAPTTPEHPDDDPRARLVKAPQAPSSPVASEPQPPATAAPLAAAATPGTVPAETPEQRPVLSSPDGDTVVAPPAPPPEAPKPLTAEQKRQAENTAKLAALFPFGANIQADPAGMPPPGQTQGASTAYRGQVYANFNKASDVIADAKARHLKGQAVVAFTVDEHGGLASLGIAVSSRNPAVDQAALELIRRAAPFPPPPPGAPRAFSPAIGLGLDD